MGKIKYYYNCKFVYLLKASAITFGSRIFYSFPDDEVPENVKIHEHTHLKQYEEYGILKFLFLYIKNYIKGRLNGLSHWESYYQIPFEVEAFNSEKNI